MSSLFRYVSVVLLPVLLAVTLAPAQPAATNAATDPYRVFPTAPPALRKTLDALAEKHFVARKTAIAAITTPAALQARQKRVRGTILAGFDGWPERTPLNARIVATLQRDGYRIEKLLYQSLPGLYATANVYVPTGGTPPFPAVLGTAGHANEGKASATYQHGWIAMAKRGYIVLAYDPIGQGERLQYIDEDTGESLVGNGTREHIMMGSVALLTGTNFARYEIWDGIRAIDYLETRPDVDPKRIAVVGNSGGGTQSAYINALEPRLATAVPSCYITSWRYLWDKPGPQDAEQVFPNFLADGFDFADFLTAYAPRPVKMLAAIQDYFPIAGAREAFAETKRLYEIAGAADKAGYFDFDDTHGWSKPRREATYQWLDQWLYNRASSEPEPPVTPEEEKTLWVTPKGQVLLSMGGKSLPQILRERAERLYGQRTAASMPSSQKAEFRALLRNTLRLLPRNVTNAPAAGAEIATLRRDGYTIEKLALPVDDGVALPALLFVPAKPKSGARPVLYLDDRGKAAEAGASGLLGALAKAGFTVLAADIRGTGEYALSDKMEGYSPLYQDAMRALLVGTSLAGIQTGDTLAALDAAAKEPAWRRAFASAGNRVTLAGKGNTGWIALFAAALDDRIHAVAAEESLLSYMDIVRSPRHYYTTDLILPGVLKQFDMPDVVASLAGKEVMLLNSRAPMDHLHSRETVRHEYTPARLAFLSAGKEDALQIRREPEDLRTGIYMEWLQ